VARDRSIVHEAVTRIGFTSIPAILERFSPSGDRRWDL
jgi:hypothetical protein